MSEASGTGAKLGSYKIAKIVSNGMRVTVVSPGGLVMIAGTTDGNPGFIPIGR